MRSSLVMLAAALVLALAPGCQTLEGCPESESLLESGVFGASSYLLHKEHTEDDVPYPRGDREIELDLAAGKVFIRYTLDGKPVVETWNIAQLDIN